MLKVNALFKWMKDRLLFEIGEKMATRLKWSSCNGGMLTRFFFIPINFLLPNFFNYKFWNYNKYIWNLKIYIQSYKMHLFCYNFKKSELTKKNNFISPNERKKQNDLKVWKYEKLMKIIFPKFWINTNYSMLTSTLTCSEKYKIVLRYQSLYIRDSKSNYGK
jgi:hypothetical protein